MQGLERLQDQCYYVVGLGKTGLSLLRAFKVSGIRAYYWDDQASRRAEAENLGGVCTTPDSLNWQEITGLVLSPGIPHQWPQPHRAAVLAEDHKIPILCDVDLFFQTKPKGKCIGVTGTNGKSTTTSLIAFVLQQAGYQAHAGGNLGTPLFDLDPLDEKGVYVIELSSYHLERVPHLNLDVAVHLNITPDHLARHKDMAGYVAAKKQIFKSARVAVVGVDDRESKEIFESLPHEIKIPLSVQHSLPQGLFLEQGRLIDHYWGERDELCTLEHLSTYLPGVHNAQNVLAAYAALRAVGLEKKDIIAALLKFQGLSHRQELVGAAHGVRFINDSKATNAEAAAKALSAYQEIYWIVGGQGKETGLSGLENLIHSVRHAYVIGASEDDFCTWLEAHHVPYTRCHTLEKAVPYAAKEAFLNRSGVVLLSPAAASFDQFENFEVRGKRFSSLVRDILERALDAKEVLSR